MCKLETLWGFCVLFFFFSLGLKGLDFVFIEGGGIWEDVPENILHRPQEEEYLEGISDSAPRCFQAAPQRPPLAKPHCHPPHFSGPPTHGLAVLPSQKCLLFCSVRLP